MGKSLRKEKKKGSGIKEYEKIDNAEGQEACIREINTFYEDRKNVDKLIDRNVVFKRKAYLFTRLKESSHNKEIWVALGPVFITAILGLILSEDMISGENGTFLIYALAAVLFIYGGILLHAILSEKESDWDQIKKYELTCIDKALEEHVPSVKEKTSLITDTEGRTSLVTFK